MFDRHYELAKLHLDTKDYTKWAQTSDATPVPSKTYSIPNTVFVDIGPRYHGDEPWYVRLAFKVSLTQTYLSAMARRTGDLYEQRGFKVVQTKNASGSTILSHLGSSDIYAYVFAGHGATGAINSTEDDAVFPGRYTQYGIQYMGVLACGSALADPSGRINSYPSNVAARGRFFGSTSNYTAILV